MEIRIHAHTRKRATPLFLPAFAFHIASSYLSQFASFYMHARRTHAMPCFTYVVLNACFLLLVL